MLLNNLNPPTTRSVCSSTILVGVLFDNEIATFFDNFNPEGSSQQGCNSCTPGSQPNTSSTKPATSNPYIPLCGETRVFFQDCPHHDNPSYRIPTTRSEMQTSRKLARRKCIRLGRQRYLASRVQELPLGHLWCHPKVVPLRKTLLLLLQPLRFSDGYIR